MSSMLVRPLPPCIPFAYNRSTSLLLWRLPDIAIYFLVLTSNVSISSLVQLRIPIVGVITGTANTLWATDLFAADSCEFQTIFTRFKYSFVTLSLFRGPS